MIDWLIDSNWNLCPWKYKVAFAQSHDTTNRRQCPTECVNWLSSTHSTLIPTSLRPHPGILGGRATKADLSGAGCSGVCWKNELEIWSQKVCVWVLTMTIIPTRNAWHRVKIINIGSQPHLPIFSRWQKEQNTSSAINLLCLVSWNTKSLVILCLIFI